MRFMVMVMATTESESAPPPSPEAFVAMQEYNEKAVKDGVLLAAEGLTPSSKGVRVKMSGKKRTVIDGPFAESKEVVAGFSIIKVNSLEEAIEWVKGAPNVSPTGEVVVEIRKLMDVEDFGDDFTPNEEIAKVKFE
ncbi:MAG TPA: YciI family protein [Gemmatimonadaceae bacterium]|nr:YciI family protein [Gemmatimonadaceae bacterium]